MLRLALAALVVVMPGCGGSQRSGGAAEPVSGRRPHLEFDQIIAVVRQHLPAIRQCYEAQRAWDSSLRGRVDVSWHVDLEGRVTTSSVVRSTLGSAEAEGCIARELQGWVFPRPNGGEVTIEFPFLFGPRDR